MRKTVQAKEYTVPPENARIASFSQFLRFLLGSLPLTHRAIPDYSCI